MFRCSLLVLALASVVNLAAQTATATLQGLVRDPSGAAVPDATVAVKNVRTGVPNTTRTNVQGRYVVPFLQPGDYEIAVDKIGFRRFVQSSIKLDVQQNLSLDVQLLLGDVATAVEVTAAPPPLATSTSTLTTTIGNQAVADLPLNGRQVLQLSLTVPAVYAAGGAAGQSGVGTGGLTMYSPAIGGGRGMTSEVMVDGAPLSVSDPTGGARAMGGQPPSVDAVEEFSVQTNALAAEYGRIGGGVINIATKQGTNQFHGTAREFLRNSKMDSNDFFSNRAGVPLSSFKRNQYGFSAGGPVFLPRVHDGRNRTFFFV
ncbi:MAG: carboxypeptidase regulatory-like domain-containing protein, partial [Acidobacteria bacterium]|nr:carboxypeptidase regulatory-like domain-containing protein [Acidobacteriota bacterium]